MPEPDAGVDHDSGVTVEREAVAERVYRRAVTHRDRELERALDRLRDRGELTQEQQQALETFAHSVTEQLLSPTCEAILSTDDPETLEAALEIFDRRE